ncbi:MAG: HAD family phosphatase [Alphaproteobacteria bacterium]|nr:HAD family phosphatase [Alphaproteobacteria bacterium]
MIELVIFDCDGVLIDSEIIARRVESEELNKLGYQVTPEEITLRFNGLSTKTAYSLMRSKYQYDLPENYATLVKERILQEFQTSLRPVDGVKETLPMLSSRFKICVASSSTPDKLRLGLTTTGLLRYFEPHLFSASMVANGKPAPDLFLLAANSLGISPNNCVVVEDSTSGIRAAKAAGMRAFGFCGGGHCSPAHGNELMASGADLSFSVMTELPHLLIDGYVGDVSDGA